MTKTAAKLLCALAFLMFMFIPGCKSLETIAEGLSQQDANIMLVALREHQIDGIKEGIANRKSTSYNVKVNSKDAKKALRILVYEQLPKTNRPGLREVYSPGSAGLIPTKSDEQARLVMAQEGELEALLKMLPNVVDARVAISIEQNPDSLKASVAKSAAVALTYKQEEADGELPLSAKEVASLVSFAVGSISIEQVMVVLKPIKTMEKFLEREKSLDPLPAPPPQKSLPPLLLWSLLGLTFFALILAAYAFIRANLNVGARSEAT
jgi:type III secretion system YscJ/HrcJ family lipoprotein